MRQFIQVWLIPVAGIVLGVLGIVLSWYGIVLTQQANQEFADAKKLHDSAQKIELQATIHKFAFMPAMDSRVYAQLSEKEKIAFLSEVMGDLDSQINNEYLIVHNDCYESWKNLDQFLFLAIKSPELFDSLGPEHSIEKNFMEKRDSVYIYCWIL